MSRLPLRQSRFSSERLPEISPLSLLQAQSISRDDEMGAENFPGDTSSRQRSAKRNRVLLAAKLLTKYGEVDARLRDLSRKGALIECGGPLAVGDEVVFSRSTTVVPARVAWVGGNRIGLEFKHMIDESEVLVQLGRPSTNATQQRFRRPALHADLSEQERKLARVWGVAVGINVSGD
jgi:hypothetical protein